MNRAPDYIAQALAATGFAVIDGEIACILRPDLWRTGIDAGRDFGALRHRSDFGEFAGTTQRFEVRFAGRDVPVLVLARSEHILPLRLQWITGREVLSCAPEVRLPTVAAVNPAAAQQAKRLEEKQAKLRAMAAQEPPEHDCALRREILRAREELARAGETWKAPAEV